MLCCVKHPKRSYLQTSDSEKKLISLEIREIESKSNVRQAYVYFSKVHDLKFLLRFSTRLETCKVFRKLLEKPFT